MGRASIGERVWREFRWAMRDFLRNGVLASGIFPPRVRARLLAYTGLDVRRAQVAAGCFIGSGDLKVGPGAFLNYQVFLDSSAGIRIGANTRIGPRSTFITASHKIGDSEATRTDRSAGSEFARPISVGDNVWVGAGVTVLPGVTIGHGCVVAAGAVVVADCPPNTLWAGVPARRVRDLPR